MAAEIENLRKNLNNKETDVNIEHL